MVPDPQKPDHVDPTVSPFLKSDAMGNTTVANDPFASQEMLPVLQLNKPVPKPVPMILTPPSAGPIDAMSAASPSEKPEPTVKEMLAKIATRPENYLQATEQKEAGKALAAAVVEKPSFGEMLKKIGVDIAGLVNAFGMGYSGHPEFANYRVEQQQAFEAKQAAAAQEAALKSQAAQGDIESQRALMQSQVQAQAQAIEQQYLLDRMDIQNKMNIANLPIEKKAELDNRLSEITAQKQADLEKINSEMNLYVAKLGIGAPAPGTD
jgi:hypothetical protein